MKEKVSTLLFCIIIISMVIICCTSETRPDDLKRLLANRDLNGLVKIMFEDKNNLARADAARYIARMKDENAIPYLVKALNDKVTINSAAFALAEMQAVSAVTDIIKAFDYQFANKEDFLRQIGRIKSKESEEFLTGHLNSDNWYIVSAAVDGLANNGTINSIQEINKLINKIEKNKYYDIMSKVISENASEAEFRLYEELKNNSVDIIPSYLLYIFDKIRDSKSEILFRDQLSSQDKLLKYGWKKENNHFVISAQTYFEQIPIVHAYNAKWKLHNNNMGFLISQDITSYKLDEKGIPLHKAEVSGSGVVQTKGGDIILKGVYNVFPIDIRLDAQKENIPIILKIHSLVYSAIKNEIYFRIKFKGKLTSELFDGDILQLLEQGADS